MFDVFEQMFDEVVNEVRKYSANVRKLDAKADKQFEQLDVIASMQVKTKTIHSQTCFEFKLARFNARQTQTQAENVSDRTR